MLCNYFLDANGKLGLKFVQAMLKWSRNGVRERKTPSLTELCTHKIAEIAKKISTTSFAENVCLVAITFVSKVGVTASKLVLIKEKMGSKGFKNYFKSS